MPNFQIFAVLIIASFIAVCVMLLTHTVQLPIQYNTNTMVQSMIGLPTGTNNIGSD